MCLCVPVSVPMSFGCNRLTDGRSKPDAQTTAIGGGGGDDGDTPPSSEDRPMDQADARHQALLAGTIVPEFTEQTVAIISRIIASAAAGDGQGRKDRTEDA